MQLTIASVTHYNNLRPKVKGHSHEINIAYIWQTHYSIPTNFRVSVYTVYIHP